MPTRGSRVEGRPRVPALRGGPFPIQLRIAGRGSPPDAPPGARAGPPPDHRQCGRLVGIRPGAGVSPGRRPWPPEPGDRVGRRGTPPGPPGGCSSRARPPACCPAGQPRPGSRRARPCASAVRGRGRPGRPEGTTREHRRGPGAEHLRRDVRPGRRPEVVVDVLGPHRRDRAVVVDVLEQVTTRELPAATDEPREAPVAQPELLHAAGLAAEPEADRGPLDRGVAVRERGQAEGPVLAA